VTRLSAPDMSVNATVDEFTGQLGDQSMLKAFKEVHADLARRSARQSRLKDIGNAEARDVSRLPIGLVAAPRFVPGAGETLDSATRSCGG